MEEPLLKPILETIRERADCALKEIERMEEPKAVKWKCSKCGHLKHFTRPVTVAAAIPGPKCNGSFFDPDNQPVACKPQSEA